MKALILILTILSTNQAFSKDFKFELMQGFATHYMSFKGYNDSVFKDNLTSTVTLGKLTYKGYGLTGLSDSQGNLSLALTKESLIYTRKALNVYTTLGAYILRNDADSGIMAEEVNNILPQIQVKDRRFTVLPLAGVQADYSFSKNLKGTILITPTFTLWGLKVQF